VDQGKTWLKFCENIKWPEYKRFYAFNPSAIKFICFIVYLIKGIRPTRTSVRQDSFPFLKVNISSSPKTSLKIAEKNQRGILNALS